MYFLALRLRGFVAAGLAFAFAGLQNVALAGFVAAVYSLRGRRGVLSQLYAPVFAALLAIGIATEWQPNNNFGAQKPCESKRSG